MELEPHFDFSRIGPKDIKIHAGSILKRASETFGDKGLFLLKTANDWLYLAKSLPIPRMLFGEFWREGEFCILFADTNLGKSILAVQIGNSISKGEQIRGFKLEAVKQLILYFDFELTCKQFETRYSCNFEQHYIFDDNFIRLEINSDAEYPDGITYEDYLSASFERMIRETGAKVIIIDNLTFLNNENEKAKDALSLMKHLKDLKNKYGLSILALAHTPKRDLSRPIHQNDLQGSKMLMNFCDSCFAIGASQIDKNLRYLKQIKERSSEKIYDAENICVCEISKKLNFLEFELVKFGNEWEHLKQYTEKDNDNLSEKVLELKQLGRSLRDIGAELGISHMKVSRILKDCNNM